MERLIECEKGFLDSEFMPVAPHMLIGVQSPELATFDAEGLPRILPVTEQEVQALGQRIGADCYSNGASGISYFMWNNSTTGAQ